MKTFSEAGLGSPADDVETVAARIRSSSVRNDIVAAVDDWALVSQDKSRLKWLLAVARAVDPDPLRDGLRQADLWRGDRQMQELVQKLKVDQLSPQLLRVAGRLLRYSGGDAAPFLRAAQERFPHDFWLNLDLGWELEATGRNDEAIGYFRAALAVRPEASAVHAAVGTNLHYRDRYDEAIRYFKRALDIDPDFAIAHNNLAFSLWNSGRRDEAIHHFNEAIRCDPEQSTTSHYNLGEAQLEEGLPDDAIRHFQEATRGEPKVSSGAHAFLGKALCIKGRLDEAVSHYREAIRIAPKPQASHHLWLANVLRDQNRPEEAIGHLQQAVQIDPRFHQAWTALGLACSEAARAAVAETSVQTSEAEQSSDSVRAAKRRQALDWLRICLDVRAKLISEGKLVRWDLSTWQTDPALAVVRDTPELARLPDAERAEWQKLWAEVSALVAASPAVDGPMYAACGDWPRAVSSYKRAVEASPKVDGHLWFEYAAVLLLSGDRSGHAKYSALLVDECGKKDGPRAYHVARTCTLAEGSVADSSLPARLAEKELNDFARDFWSLTERGALAYRAGRYREAVTFLEKSLQADRKPGRAIVNWLWLALAHQRLGDRERARRHLYKASAWLHQFHEGMPDRADESLGLHLHNWLEVQVLLREARALVRSP
jgi:tetratricopeptide (TPR) repeat protein